MCYHEPRYYGKCGHTVAVKLWCNKGWHNKKVECLLKTKVSMELKEIPLGYCPACERKQLEEKVEADRKANERELLCGEESLARSS